MMKWWAKFSSPPFIYTWLERANPYFLILTLVLFGYGLLGGLWLAPPDYQQGDGYRIIFVHVPAAFLSLFVYVIMASYAAIGLIWRLKTAHIFTKTAAPIGALFTALALVTGAIWGKPMWGTWWIWDARLTSELILFFLYCGVIALGNAIPEREKADKARALLAVIGVINIPIIHFSVDWWFTLHQGRTVTLMNSHIAAVMRYPLYAMILGFMTYFLLVWGMRIQNEILQREHQAQWVKTWRNQHS